MLAKIKTSCLTPKHAAALRLEPHVEGHELPVTPNWAGFKIPYFDLNGKIVDFFRFRYTQLKPSTGFRAVADDPVKPLRYSQPKGSECHVYLPPLLPYKWRELAEDTSRAVVITEGELKAACGCALGVPTLGLGGVFNWRSTRLNQELIPALEAFKWKDRVVALCFDSDTTTNPMVRMAAGRLATTLLRRGAVMREAVLPPAAGNAKQGMDDFIYANGVEAFAALLAQATDVANSAALHQLNLEAALVRATAEVVLLESAQVYSARTFIDVLCKDRKYTEQVELADGTKKLVVKFAAKEWLEWPQRSVVTNLVYAPGESRITSAGAYNTWRGWACAPVAKGTLAPWEDLIGHMFQNAQDPAHVLWLKRWLAYPLRHPGTKLFSAVLVWGLCQGTGKTLLGETMADIYGVNYRSITSLDLVSPYNDWVVGHQFIVGDEISVGGQARRITDNLKDIISRTSVVVNLKYQRQYTVRDCNNYYFTSNHAEALFIEDSDRRYFVHEVTAPPLPGAVYERYTKWLRAEGGAARLFHHLAEELDLGDFNPRGAPPMTAHKQDMIVYNRSELDAWCATLRETPAAVLKAAGLPLPYSLYTARDLQRLFDPDNTKRYTTNAVSRALRKAGVPTAAHGDNHITVDGARVRVWAVREAQRYERANPSAVQQAYEAERVALRVKGGLNMKKEKVM